MAEHCQCRGECGKHRGYMCGAQRGSTVMPMSRKRYPWGWRLAMTIKEEGSIQAVKVELVDGICQFCREKK